MGKRMKVIFLLVLTPIAIGIWIVVIKKIMEPKGGTYSFGSTSSPSNHLTLPSSDLVSQNATNDIGSMLIIGIITVVLIGIIIYFSKKGK